MRDSQTAINLPGPKARSDIESARKKLRARRANVDALRKAFHFHFAGTKRLADNVEFASRQAAPRWAFLERVRKEIEEHGEAFSRAEGADEALVKAFRSLVQSLDLLAESVARLTMTSGLEQVAAQLVIGGDANSFLSSLKKRYGLTGREIACVMACGLDPEHPKPWVPAYNLIETDEGSIENAIDRAHQVIRKIPARAAKREPPAMTKRRALSLAKKMIKKQFSNAPAQKKRKRRGL